MVKSIPIILERDINHVIGFVTFENSFEDIMLHSLKNGINFKIGGAINLDKNQIVYLSTSPDIAMSEK